MTTQQMIERLQNEHGRSAWERGVNQYALDLLNREREIERQHGRPSRSVIEFREWLRQGTTNWREYSYTGMALREDKAIADRLCTPSEAKRLTGGFHSMDVQARALSEACRKLCMMYVLP